jgi:hypothetical protein
VECTDKQNEVSARCRANGANRQPPQGNLIRDLNSFRKYRIDFQDIDRKKKRKWQE